MSEPPATTSRERRVPRSEPRPSAPAAARPEPATRLPARVVVADVTPAVDGGRFAAKRIVYRPCAIGADVFREGHDVLRARVRWRGPTEPGAADDAPWRTTALAYDPDEDRWTGEITPDALGVWHFTVDGWTDAFATWVARLEKRVAAQQPEVAGELLEGARLVLRAAGRAPLGAARRLLEEHVALLGDASLAIETRVAAALSPDLAAAMTAHAPLDDLTSYDRELPLLVERERAAFAAWYEFFPRSTAREAARHGTFADAERALPRIAALGFDVVYLPPIHPIGVRFRKGRNNTLTPEPGDVGSPWAIGGEAGGHTAVHPELGTLDDFERFVARAGALGLEVALDFALQASPDHPWVREHPEWFTVRADGTIAYAENPPKKYQDIYPIDFWSEGRDALWDACRDALLFWCARGVRTFRVDNPHTKPFAFWEWALAEVRRAYPDTVFLSEAFTRPKKLLHLAKLGFSQSYGYFTWKVTGWQLEQWMEEFTTPEVCEYHRGNLFVNTPDILHESLQTGGPGMFRLRLLLAGTLSPLYGVYSGYEWLEHEAVKPGSEEYRDSEKFELRPRDWEGSAPLDADLRRLNAVRRAEPALQRQENLRFLGSQNERVLCWRRPGVDGSADVLVVVNLDPRTPQASMVEVPLERMGLDEHEPFQVEDLLTGARYTWRGRWNYVHLDPSGEPGHVLRVGATAGRPRDAQGDVVRPKAALATDDAIAQNAPTQRPTA
jgi:starch synthase (maltosyl-transferring)